GRPLPLVAQSSTSSASASRDHPCKSLMHLCFTSVCPRRRTRAGNGQPAKVGGTRRAPEIPCQQHHDRFAQPTVWESAMTILVIGGSGFIGYRLVRLLVARGETVFCLDADPDAHSFADLGAKVSSVRGDVAQFEDVMRAMTAAKPERVVNLAYLI